MTKCQFLVSWRDDYDKEVKQAKELQRRRHTTTPRRPRRPDIQVYHPRRRRAFGVLCCYVCVYSKFTKSSEKNLCVCVRAHFARWIRAGGRCWGWRVEREWVKHRDGDPRNWTLLARLSGGLWYHYLLPCAQGQYTSLWLMFPALWSIFTLLWS